MFNNNKGAFMITHQDIWSAIDAVAVSHKITLSRMAINCGLDANTFNKSKRLASYGKLRWPSSETIAKILNRHNITMMEFGCMCDKCVAERIKREQQQGRESI